MSAAVLPRDDEIETMRRLIHSELRRYADHEDAEDIAQEALLESWRQWERLRGRYALSTVVKVCARTAFTSWIRSRKGRRQWRPPGRRPPPTWEFLDELTEAEQPQAFDSPAAALERIAALQMAALALAAMTPRQAQLVRRSVMADRTYQSAAQALGISTKTAWVLVQRGLEHGRRALESAP